MTIAGALFLKPEGARQPISQAAFRVESPGGNFLRSRREPAPRKIVTPTSIHEASTVVRAPSVNLASGNAPGMEPDDIVKAPSPLVPIAQYLVLVVGLVMVLIGVFVMIANSHVT